MKTILFSIYSVEQHQKSDMAVSIGWRLVATGGQCLTVALLTLGGMLYFELDRLFEGPSCL